MPITVIQKTLETTDIHTSDIYVSSQTTVNNEIYELQGCRGEGGYHGSDYNDLLSPSPS